MSRPLLPGDPRRLGRYSVLARLGQGGMGTVYLGEAPDGREVAIKMVRAEFSHEAEFRGRFRSEVNRAQQVPPFSTAEVLDADPDHDPPYLVVEYVDGPSLAAVVRDRGPLGGAALHSLAVGIATALTAIHGAGVIHRDLKPANVLLARGGLKVIDFGIAKPLEATSHHTAVDHMVGTVAYMAPERLEPGPGQVAGFPGDVFAFGAVIAYAATGRTPFAADSAPATALRILTGAPDLTGVPGSLRDLVARTLARNPAERPTARELLDALLSGPAPVTEPPVPPAALDFPGEPPEAWRTPPPAPVVRPRRTRRGLLLAGAAVLTVAVVGGAGLLLAAGGGTPEPQTEPAPVAEASPAATTNADGILVGSRRTLLHMATIDRDLALPDTGPARASDGTGPDALFILESYGVDYLIKAVRPGSRGQERCLGVKVDPDGPGSLVATACSATKATIFGIQPAEGRDEKGRPTYTIGNEAYGLVQWSENRRAVYVEEAGDFPNLLSFSLVDRGPA
ncbi:serine/threonine-protein kinase [Actinoplanes sp. NPDC051475]|uniref:serine/threonine-protein kinase n=1 Tax=Actinoplanes sp. NPDC051475 TaxID=3157225 RepID=UPI00344B5C5F